MAYFDWRALLSALSWLSSDLRSRSSSWLELSWWRSSCSELRVIWRSERIFFNSHSILRWKRRVWGLMGFVGVIERVRVRRDLMGLMQEVIGTIVRWRWLLWSIITIWREWVWDGRDGRDRVMKEYKSGFYTTIG